LDALGYEREFPFSENKKFSKAEIGIFNAINASAKEAARKLATKEDVERRAAQDAFIAQLKTKFHSFKSVVS